MIGHAILLSDLDMHKIVLACGVTRIRFCGYALFLRRMLNSWGFFYRFWYVNAFGCKYLVSSGLL